MDLGLQGKVALVTGGARDIGREISLALAREDAAVAVNYYRSKAAAEALVEEIRRGGGRAAAWQADVADYFAVEAMVDRIVKELGGIHILVNNAGYIEQKLFLDTRPGEWRRQIDVCFGGVLNCCHVIGRRLAAQRWGRIVSIVGDSARVGQSRIAVSAAARGGVLSLTRSLAKELGRFDVTVNALALGWVETAHSDQAWLAAHREKILSFYPIRRLGRPEDVAPFVAFLASEPAGWVTGQTISVSGGYSAI